MIAIDIAVGQKPNHEFLISAVCLSDFEVFCNVAAAPEYSDIRTTTAPVNDARYGGEEEYSICLIVGTYEVVLRHENTKQKVIKPRVKSTSRCHSYICIIEVVEGYE